MSKFYLISPTLHKHTHTPTRILTHTHTPTHLHTYTHTYTYTHTHTHTHTLSQEKLLGHLGVVLYEYLGEEYPEVLGSILAGLKAIVNVIGMTKMTPPIKDLLPRLTPILKNRFVRHLNFLPLM